MIIASHSTAWKPTIIPNINASTEPITVKKPLTPQAQGMSEGCSLLINVMPSGKGMPSNMPNGNMSRMAINILTVMGRATADLSNDGRKKLAMSNNIANNGITIFNAGIVCLAYRPDIYAPIPVNNNSDAKTTAML